MALTVAKVSEEMQGNADEIARLLDGRTLACAESCTGGLVTQAFAAVEGSGEWLRGGVVAYQRESKVDVLGVDPEAPLVSATVAEQMARGVAQCMHADVALATTGAAGPDGHGGVPPGTVVIATCVDGDVRCMEHHYDDHDDPATVVELAARDAITVLANALAAGRHGSVSVDTGTRARHAERR